MTEAMKIIVIGGTGTLGSAVAAALEANHEVVRASRKSEPRVNLDDPASVRGFWKGAGEVDAVVCCAGTAGWAKLTELSDDDFELGLRSKLMGQVNLVRAAAEHLRDGGSITLTAGVLARDPMPESAVVSLVNAGLEGFTRAAALTLPRGLRVNVVSPPWLKETLEAMGAPAADAMPAARAAKAYVDAVEGTMTGQVLEPA